MKILYIVTSIKKGGPQKVLDGIINYINDEVYIISLFGKDDEDLLKDYEKRNIKVIRCNLNKYTILFSKSIKKIIKNIQPDIIHSHGFWPDYVNSKLKNNTITTLHNNMFEDYIYTFGHLKGSIMIKIHRYSLKRIKKIICCSKSIYDIMKKYYKEISYIQNGVEFVPKNEQIRNEIRNKYNIRKNDIVYLYAGVLSSRKNVLKLLELFNKYAKANEYLWILGDGEEYQLCLPYSNDKIKLFGFKNNVDDYLMASDVYISASNSEGLSISVLEALSQNNFLLLSNIPSHNEIINISNYYVGETFEENDFEKKKEILCNYIKKYKKINKNVLDIISAQNMSKKYKEKYSEISNNTN